MRDMKTLLIGGSNRNTRSVQIDITFITYLAFIVIMIYYQIIIPKKLQ